MVQLRESLAFLGGTCELMRDTPRLGGSGILEDLHEPVYICTYIYIHMHGRYAYMIHINLFGSMCTQMFICKLPPRPRKTISVSVLQQMVASSARPYGQDESVLGRFRVWG